MNISKISLVISFATLCFFGCKKEDIETTTIADADYFIFGHFFGECGGEQCVEIYKINLGQLFEDTNDIYPLNATNQAYDGNFTLLDPSLHDQVVDIIDQFPSNLWAEPEKVIGQPDAGDWGGFYIENSQNGTVGYWFIDTNKSNLPEYLHDFTDVIAEKIQIINN